ncbi:hypothetical protein TMatcc_003642 [Talaromyces marneffei ATCC 18224]
MGDITCTSGLALKIRVRHGTIGDHSEPPFAAIRRNAEDGYNELLEVSPMYYEDRYSARKPLILSLRILPDN